MARTPKFGLTYLEVGQASAEAVANDWANVLETVSQLAIIDRDLTAPPGLPAEGDVYIVGASATGDWASQDGDLAFYFSGWRFVTPTEGMRAWVEDEDAWIIYDGTKWHVYEAAPVTLTDGATIDWDMCGGPMAQVTLGGNRTLTTPRNIKY